MSRQPVVVVTGTSRGIGLAVTSALLTKFHAIVVALSRTESPELTELINAYPSSLLFSKCDVSKETELIQAISDAQNIHKHIDALILNAGTLNPLARIDSTEHNTDTWRTHFEVNFFSLVTAVKAALPALRNSDVGGRVIFVSSGAAVGGISGCGPYNAGKAAMNSLCRTLAQEEPSITAVALRPGMVETAMQVQLRTHGAPHLSANDFKKHLQAYAEGKLVKPEDVAHVIAALSIKAPKSLSGHFVSWDSEECREFRREAS